MNIETIKLKLLNNELKDCKLELLKLILDC